MTVIVCANSPRARKRLVELGDFNLTMTAREKKMKTIKSRVCVIILDSKSHKASVIM